MNLISIENLKKSFSEKILFNEISFGINEGEKIGLIGVNGCGKSTLLKIIAGIEEQDQGSIISSKSLTIEYLSQEPVFNEDNSIIDEIFNGNSEEFVILREYESTLNSIEDNPADIKLQNKLIQLASKIDELNAWDTESTAKAILNKLGVSNFSKKISTLSGGQKKRIALAASLIRSCDLLILDEPTNHMDNETIGWLEKHLSSRKGALLMITHDRYFLDRISNRILELENGNLYSYDGNFSVFLEKKIERESLEKSSEEKRQNLLKRELAWIKKGAKARTTKQKARIGRFNDLSSIEKPVEKGSVEISTAHSRLGSKIMIIENLSKSFNNHYVIKDLSYIMGKDDRIGIIGPNGAGKSTLMNLITKKLSIDSGTIDLGETVKIGYFCQANCYMNDKLRVIEYIKESAEFISTADGDKISASQMLEKFLFTPDEQWTPISKLSGGEKRRLFLLKVLMDSPNVLLLDEPTNDLDIATLQILEDYIENFNGPVMAVSHDRYFLDKISNKILSFQGNGDILEHTGNYSDFVNFKDLKENNEDQVNNKTINKKTETTSNDNNSKFKNNKLTKLSYKDQREFDEIEDVINDIEEDISKIDEQISKNLTDYSKLEELLRKKSSTEALLEEKINRWEYLNDLDEQIKLNKENNK